MKKFLVCKGGGILKKRSVISVVLVVIMIAAVAAGCGGGKSPGNETQPKNQEKKAQGQEAAQEPITLKFNFMSDDKEVFEEVAAEYKKSHPHVDFEMTSYPNKEYKDKLLVQLAGGAVVDLFANGNTRDFAEFAVKGQALDIQDFVKRDKFDVSPYGPLYDALFVKGKLYALPYRRTVWVL